MMVSEPDEQASSPSGQGLSPTRLDRGRKYSSTDLKEMFAQQLVVEQDEFDDDPFEEKKKEVETAYESTLQQRIRQFEEELKAVGLIEANMAGENDQSDTVHIEHFAGYWPRLSTNNARFIATQADKPGDYVVYREPGEGLHGEHVIVFRDPAVSTEVSKQYTEIRVSDPAPPEFGAPQDVVWTHGVNSFASLGDLVASQRKGANANVDSGTGVPDSNHAYSPNRTDEEIEANLGIIFDLFDADGSGTLSLDECTELARKAQRWLGEGQKGLGVPKSILAGIVRDELLAVSGETEVTRETFCTHGRKIPILEDCAQRINHVAQLQNRLEDPVVHLPPIVVLLIKADEVQEPNDVGLPAYGFPPEHPRQKAAKGPELGADSSLLGKFFIDVPVLYCASVPLRKPLKALSLAMRNKVCRRVIHEVKLAIEPSAAASAARARASIKAFKSKEEPVVPWIAQKGTGWQMTANSWQIAAARSSQKTTKKPPPKSPEDQLFESYVALDRGQLMRKKYLFCVSASTGIGLFDSKGELAKRVELDELSFIAGGLNDEYPFFCFVTRVGETRYCHVFKSPQRSDLLLDEVGLKAREHFVEEDAALKMTRRGSVLGERMVERLLVRRDEMLRAETIKVRNALGLDGGGNGDDDEDADAGYRFEDFPSQYDGPPAFDVDDDDDAALHPLEEWLHTGAAFPPTNDYLYPPGPHRQFDQVSKPLEDRLEVVKFNTLRDWYAANPHATDMALADVTAIADAQMEDNLEEWERYLQEQYENDELSHKVSPRPFVVAGDQRTKVEVPTTNSTNEAEAESKVPVQKTLFDDEEEYTDSFGFTYRRPRPGSVVAQVEEQLDEFDGFAEADLEFASPTARGEETENWGFGTESASQRSSRQSDVKPGKKQVFESDERRLVIPRGANGKTGVTLSEQSDGTVLIVKTTKNSTAAATLGCSGELPSPIEIVRVFGQPCKGKARVIALMKSEPERGEVILDVIDRQKAPSLQGSRQLVVPHVVSSLGPREIIIPRGANGKTGVKLQERANGSVFITRASPNTPAAAVLGELQQPLQIVKVFGETVQGREAVITLMKSQPHRSDVVLIVADQPKAQQEVRSGQQSRRTEIRRGPNGKTGVKLVELPDGRVYIEKTTQNSPAAEALGCTGVLPEPLQVLSVYGQPCQSKEAAIALMKSRPEETVVVLELSVLQSAVDNASGDSWSCVDHAWPQGQPRIVTIPRTSSSLGLGLKQHDDAVYVAQTKRGSPGEAAFGSTEKLGRLRILTVDGDPISHRTQCIEALQAKSSSEQSFQVEIVSESGPDPSSAPAQAVSWRISGGRKEAEKVLRSQKSAGAFVIRPSSQTSSGFVLSVLKADGETVKHFPIHTRDVGGQTMFSLTSTPTDSSQASPTIEDIVRVYQEHPLDTEGLVLQSIVVD